MGTHARARSVEQMEHDNPETGEPRVDQVVAGLNRLADLPPDEHVAVFEHAHATLRQVLNELGSGPADAAGR
jgi:hypothetical protein